MNNTDTNTDTNTEEKQNTVTLPSLDEWPCPYCTEIFDDHRKRNGHVISHHPDQPMPHMTKEQILARKRVLNAQWRATRKVKKKPAKRLTPFPSDTPEYRRAMYRRHVARNAAKGLNAHGEPFKLPQRAVTAIQKAQKIRRARERREKLASTPQAQPTPGDNMAETARAVMIAAQVLRAVSVGLNL